MVTERARGCLRTTRNVLRVALGLTLVLPRGARAHPIHTTLTELAARPDGSVTLRIRAFVDDFGAAVARYARTRPAPDFTVPDTDVARYVSGAVRVSAASGHSVSLGFVSQRRTGDVVWLEFRALEPLALSGARVLNSLLFEVHPDQVNIVQANYGAVKHTTLFSAGDGPKRLP